MTLQRQMLFWIGALVVLVFLLWEFQTVLLPFIAGFVLAYFLDPVADRLQRLGLPRLWATAVIIIAALLAIAAIGVLVIPLLFDQVLTLAGELPNFAKFVVQQFNDRAPARLKDLVSGTDISANLSAVAGSAAQWMATLSRSLLSGSMIVANAVSVIVITPIVAFYILYDWDRMVAKVDSWLPRNHVADIRTIARDVDNALAGFIRGQGAVCLILGCFYALLLMVVGLKSGLAVGLLAGLLTFIPYFGALIGGILAVGLAAMQFWPNATMIGVVGGIFLLGQFIEGNFLSPRLVGHSIGLHPVWLMFALLAVSYVFGVLGLLLAVPLAAVLGVFIRHGLKRYLNSSLYTGVAE